MILFGLSMDYHVFILTRIKEAVDRGESTDDAVAHGIKSTAGVVTAAAMVMVGVFSIFATLSLIDFKQFGVGLAAAVLIDATLVRGVLLPGDDEAARRLELVPAAAAAVAATGVAGHPPSGPAGSRAGSGLTPASPLARPHRRPDGVPSGRGLAARMDRTEAGSRVPQTR